MGGVEVESRLREEDTVEEVVEEEEVEEEG